MAEYINAIVNGLDLYKAVKDLFENICDVLENVGPNRDAEIQAAHAELSCIFKDLGKKDPEFENLPLSPLFTVRLKEIQSLYNGFPSDTNQYGCLKKIQTLSIECTLILSVYITVADSKNNKRYTSSKVEDAITDVLEKTDYDKELDRQISKDINRVFFKLDVVKNPYIIFTTGTLFGFILSLALTINNFKKESLRSLCYQILDNAEFFLGGIGQLLLSITPLPFLSKLGSCKEMFFIISATALLATALLRIEMGHLVRWFFQSVLTGLLMLWVAFLCTQVLIFLGFTDGWLIIGIIAINVFLGWRFASKGNSTAPPATP